MNEMEILIDRINFDNIIYIYDVFSAICILLYLLIILTEEVLIDEIYLGIPTFYFFNT